jgi:hypothetical protein
MLVGVLVKNKRIRIYKMDSVEELDSLMRLHHLSVLATTLYIIFYILTLTLTLTLSKETE